MGLVAFIITSLLESAGSSLLFVGILITPSSVTWLEYRNSPVVARYPGVS
jgi:hypothetical protein